MTLYLLIAIVSPFLAAAMSVPVVRLAPRASGWILALAPLASFGLLCVPLLLPEHPLPVHLSLPWIPSLGIHFSLQLDALSQSFALLISGIGVLIAIYAGAYLKGDPRLGRFLVCLFAFMGAMLGVVLSGDLLTLFIFWELTSITSYLLIGFDHHKPEARASALQALLVTGGGGLAMLAGFILLGEIAGSYAFTDLLAASGAIQAHTLYPVVFALILLGACTKSAQFPFHFWLPNAMAAPTPVSAYLHSSTMVKAGVFLLARMHPMLGDTQLWHVALTTIGATTAVVGGYLALRQSIMKPLLAYTTVSALGLLVACLGLGTPAALKAMMLFLFVHAFYKAGLFMVAGTLDHETGEKNAEKLGGLARVMPLTMIGAGLTALSMAGLPPLLGFIGKEVLYETAIDLWESQAQAGLYALLVAAFVAANLGNVFAALLVGWRPFWGRPPALLSHAHEGPPALWLGPLLLGALSLACGLYANPLADALIAPAAAVMQGAPVPVKLVLWHGLNPALYLSGVTLAGGLLIFLARNPLRRGLALLARADAAGPEAAYGGALGLLQWTARTQTRILQNGYLRVYLLVIIAFVVVLPGSALLFRPEVLRPSPGSSFDPFGTVLVLTIMAGAVAVTLMHTRLAAVACLGLIGCGISLVYVLYGAPDLAMTQFVIEILTVVLFILVLHRLPSFTHVSSRAVRLRDAIFAGIAGTFMALLVYAAVNVEFGSHISWYYLENSQPKAHGRDIVNTILVDFRALDTLGEITVLAVAALGALALLRLRPDREDGQ
jgi:multicomponent Na+:H+ antiporter subunit A